MAAGAWRLMVLAQVHLNARHAHAAGAGRVVA